MGAKQQSTLAEAVEFTGVGLHSGDPCHIVLNPAGADTGIVFQRRDLVNGARKSRYIAAGPGFVSATHLGTTLSNAKGISVATVEHLMGALALCQIDNVRIDVSGGEIPILDGSAAPFVAAITAAGMSQQAARRSVLAAREPLRVGDGERFITIEPLEYLRLDIEIDFEDCVIGRQNLSVRLDDRRDLGRLAASRTFCLLNDVERMRTAGLIRGGSLENSIVVDGDRMLNGEALRDPEEFALHKALDLIGDLYLLGGPVVGHIRAHKPGHDLNNRFARALQAQLCAPAPVDHAQVAAATA